MTKLRLAIGAGAVLAAGACARSGEWVAALVIGAVGAGWVVSLGERRDG